MPFTIPDNDVAPVSTNQSLWFQTDIDILTAAQDGVVVLNGCDPLAQGVAGMTVRILSGNIQIADGSSFMVPSGIATIGTANGTNPRIDLITASTNGTKTVTAGTAAANPKPAALPAGHVGLAMVYVPANAAVVSGSHITDKRVFSEQIPAVSDSTPATTPHNGMLWWDTDDNTAPGGQYNPPMGLYDPGSFTVATGYYAVMTKELKLTGSERATLQGTARLRIT